MAAKAQTLGEFDRIQQLFAPLAHAAAQGLGNDAAVLAIPPHQELVMTTDMLVAGVHFMANDTPENIAHKALAVNYSDLAAMGAVPLGYMLATALSPKQNDAWLQAFAKCLARLQQKWGGALLGGDSVKNSRNGSGTFSITLSAFGLVPYAQSLPRACAMLPADIYVSGTVGDAALGLKLAQKKLRTTPDLAKSLLARYHRPTPRLALGAALRSYALAAIDVSDGLLADLGHIALASNALIEVRQDKIPISKAAKTLLHNNPKLWPDIYAGGDDYELAFAAPLVARPAIAALAKKLALPLSLVGQIRACQRGESAGQVKLLDSKGNMLHTPRRGYVHF